ncbi:MAG: 4-oxalocrotonate tautomerase family protein [Verrucomicrobia bacterium]|nr:4-oxalocrotonate tautomerase family protein [Verrucomicrobiota bacterium]
MPVINVKVIRNFFNEKQKRAMIERLTDTFVACAGVEGVRPYVNVQIEEVDEGHWGLGGRVLPDPNFLVNGFPPMVEQAAVEFSQVYNVPMNRSADPARRSAETPSPGAAST